MESHTESPEGHYQHSTRRIGQRKQPSIKRACNECRQQKLRCDVVLTPFSTCSRCHKFELDCKIDANFKRIEKRRTRRERQREHQLLDKMQPEPSVAGSTMSPAKSQPTGPHLPGSIPPQNLSHAESRILSTIPTTPEDVPLMLKTASQWPTNCGPLPVLTHSVVPRRSGPETSVESQRQDSRNLGLNDDNASIHSVVTPSRKLDGVELSSLEVQDLFKIFFRDYHLFLPFLDAFKSPDHYYQSSRLLFWAVISVASRRYTSDLSLLPSLAISVRRLLWSVLQSIPQNYHDVKALCLLCTWPFPMSSSSNDPTFMLSGTMMHLAMQVGLHRPSQAQDFSQFKIRLPPEDLQDRALTWMTCKIVAQSVSTGYGQPSTTALHETFNTQLSPPLLPKESQELRGRLRIEELSDRITKSLYLMPSAVDLNSDSQQYGLVNLLTYELSHLESEYSGSNPSIALLLYFRCAQLHIRLYALFNSPTSQNYINSLLSLYGACQSLLELVLTSSEDVSSHCPNYIFQMILASALTVRKVLESPMIEYVDATAAKVLFNSAIVAIRKISVSNNDIPGRLAEVLAQLKARGNRAPANKTSWQSFHLKVRSRMSMSILFDSLWEWRNGFAAEESRGSSHQNTGTGTPSQSQASPTTAHAGRSNISSSSIPIQSDFDLNDFMFGDFYPVNWIV